MPQPFHPAQQFFLQTSISGRCVRITRDSNLALELFQSKLSKFQGTRKILRMTFIVNCQLLACQNRILSMADKLMP